VVQVNPEEVTGLERVRLPQQSHIVLYEAGEVHSSVGGNDPWLKLCEDFVIKIAVQV